MCSSIYGLRERGRFAQSQYPGKSAGGFQNTAARHGQQRAGYHDVFLSFLLRTWPGDPRLLTRRVHAPHRPRVRRRRRPVVRLVLIGIKRARDWRPNRCRCRVLRFRPARRRHGYVDIVERVLDPATARRKVPQFGVKLVQTRVDSLETALQADDAERHDQKRQPEEQRGQQQYQRYPPGYPIGQSEVHD